MKLSTVRGSLARPLSGNALHQLDIAEQIIEWAEEARSYLKYETSPWALDLMRRYDEIASPHKEKESSDAEPSS